MNGRTVEDHIGRTVHEVLGDQGQEAERLVREVIARGELIQFEMPIPGADGSPEAERILEATYFPVFAEPDRLLGVGAIVRDVTERHSLEQQRLRLLEQALEAKAVADEERRAANAARRRASFLATVTRRMSASLDYEATLREVAASAVPYIADWCLISVLESPAKLRIVGLAHRDPERERLARAFTDERPAELTDSVMQVLRTGQPQIAWDVGPEELASVTSDPERLEMARRLGVRHYGTWPVPGPNEQIVGALSLVLGDSGRRFTEGDVELATALATRAGLHITNARLYTERSEIARTLQSGLLPRAVPDVPGVEIASAFVAAGSANIVGGDLLDVFAVPGDGWGLVIGDVSGKGAAAAAVTAGVRHTLRAAALTDPSPAANLDLLNRVLLSDPGAADFCTGICARVRTGRDGVEITLANGGHPPAMLVRPTGAIEPVTGGKGPIVGALVDARFTETTIALTPGALLLLYTDGVTEASTSDLAAGERALVSVLERHRGEDAGAVVTAVKDRALGLQEGSQRDDIAVLGIRVPVSG
jgi:GAF domain-containing protein